MKRYLFVIVSVIGYYSLFAQEIDKAWVLKNDAIDWILKNIPHNNGKVGVFGISYPGCYSTMAAASIRIYHDQEHASRVVLPVLVNGNQ